LSPGYLARCENKRLNDGVCSNRLGTGFPGSFNPDFANILLGSEVFNNPNGEETLLAAELDATYVSQPQDGKDGIQINLHSGQNTGLSPVGLVKFVQAFDKVILLRFPIGSQVPLVWDGDPTHTFDPITLIPPGLNLIPTTLFGVPFKNRIIYYSPYS